MVSTFDCPTTEILPEMQPYEPEANLLVVRETPAWKVRDRWTALKAIREEMSLHHDLSMSESAPKSDIERGPFAEFLDMLGAMFCRAFHDQRDMRTNSTHQYQTCSCGRKYALPWADFKRLDFDVFVPGAAFVKPLNQTHQAICHNGTQSAC